jgi:ribulose-phosphate 3-epimerase
MDKKLISASILSANFSKLGQELKTAEKGGVDWIHFDVMDGCFVPNISFGIPVLYSIRPQTKLPFDVHLMILDPRRYVKQFREAGADLITIHAEACLDLKGNIQDVLKTGAKVGVSINPKTPLENVISVLPEIDLILFMGVEPGFGGQTYDHDVTKKITAAKSLIDKNGYRAVIEVDGGVNAETAKEISDAGCDVFVAGSYIFNHPKGVDAAVAELRKKI